MRLHFALFDVSSIDAKPYTSTLFGAMGALIALQWVQWPLVTLWFLAVALVPQGQHLLRKRCRALPHTKASVPVHLRQRLLIEVPLHLVWMLFVPMCWVHGDVFNNAFLLVFMLGCVTSSARLYGPCYPLSFVVIAIYLPVFALYTLTNGSYMGLIMPVMQLCYLGLLATLSLHHYRTFRKSFIRLVTIEGLLEQLGQTRDAAESANRAKSAFLAGMSHELRTPLNAIIGFSDLIRQGVFGPVQPAKYRSYAEDIYNSGQHLLNLINDVLDLSKIEAGKRELDDSIITLADLAEDAALFVRLQAEDAGVRITFDIDPSLRLRADERAIRQILINFLSNAIKYSPEGENITLFAHTDKKGMNIGVSDHGIGMDAAGIEKALQPYGQAHPNAPGGAHGTGLGLPIAKALIEAHGAIFHITSAVGTGTKVWGFFPASRVAKL
ncbi:MAG: HAMP domain-containing sensor histidine kinase [Rhizomicrobium sp.]